MPEFLSEHFTLEELTVTSIRGLNNKPGQIETQNLTRLALTLLEPTRRLLGCPLHINSGFRSPAVNARVGGNPSGAHPKGLAADFIPIKQGLSLIQAAEIIIASQIQYDQLIFENFGGVGWIHLALNPFGASDRRQNLMIFKSGIYLPFDSKKIPS